MSAPTLRASYAEAFDPSTELRSFSRQALAHLGREYLLLGHLVDRVGIPLVMQQFGEEANVQFSIDEWMGASPIYSKRMQRALGFEGSDVSTVFKNLQLDIGGNARARHETARRAPQIPQLPRRRFKLRIVISQYRTHPLV